MVISYISLSSFPFCLGRRVRGRRWATPRAGGGGPCRAREKGAHEKGEHARKREMEAREKIENAKSNWSR
jgi:hypothetical protein